MRAARPDLFPGEGLVPGTTHDVTRAFLHLDLKQACSYPGCPKLTTLFARGIPADLYLLAGALAIGVTAGIAAGGFCATHPRTKRAPLAIGVTGGIAAGVFGATPPRPKRPRLVETAASLAYCTPVYVFGMGLLRLFEPSFGVVHAPLFFPPGDYAPPLENPWMWLRG